MDVIFVVSSSYLEPLFKHAKKFKFKLQAYSDFKTAAKRIAYVNKADIIGVAIVDDRIEDKQGLDEFLHACNVIGDLNVLFATLKEEKSFLSLKPGNLHVSYIPSLEVFTDITITRDIYGSLLLKKFEPYKLKRDETNNTPYTIPRLNYSPIISTNILNVLQPANLIHTLQEAIETDENLLEYKNTNQMLYQLRLLYLKNWYGQAKKSDYKELYEKIMNVKDDILFCQYMSILEMISGGVAV